MAVATVVRPVFEAKCREWQVDPWTTEFAVELAFYGEGVRARPGGLFVWPDRIEHISYDSASSLLARGEGGQTVDLAMSEISVFAQVPLRDRHRAMAGNVERIFSLLVSGERRMFTLVDHSLRFEAVVRSLMAGPTRIRPAAIQSPTPAETSRNPRASVNRLLRCAYEWSRLTQLDVQCQEEIRSFGPDAADRVVASLVRATRSEFKHLDTLTEIVGVYVRSHPDSARAALLGAVDPNCVPHVLDALSAVPNLETTRAVLERVPFASARPAVKIALVQYVGDARDPAAREALEQLENSELDAAVRSEWVIALHNCSLPVPSGLTRSSLRTRDANR